MDRSIKKIMVSKQYFHFRGKVILQSNSKSFYGFILYLKLTTRTQIGHVMSVIQKIPVILAILQGIGRCFSFTSGHASEMGVFF